jgi:two-component system, chemotaxis family, CheB/CheR fusion protein
MMRLRGISVLLVEDDVDNLELLSSFLEDEGARTFSAGSIAAALAITVGQHVDVVISDLDLADGDGCALLDQLRKREGREHFPAIAVTGYSEQKWRKKAGECGFARYAVKPYSLDEVVDWVAELSRAASAGGDASASLLHAPPVARVRLAR